MSTVAMPLQMPGPDTLPASRPMVIHDDLPAERCDAYVLAHASGRSCHRPRWCAVVREAFGHDTAFLAAESDGVVSGVLPLVFFRSRLFGTFTVSMPFLNQGGILADSMAAQQALLDRAIEETQRRGGTHLELRHTAQFFSALQPRRHKVAMELTLEATIEEQWTALDRKVRNQVRKAEKSGLTCHVGGLELLDAFYDVFARNMRDLGTPVYSKRWFAAVLAAFPETSRVFVIRHQGSPVAASIVHAYKDRIEVPWASALRESNPLCANVLLYWTMIRSAITDGRRLFDFGRSTPGEGTFHFKKGWGAEPHALVWEYWTMDGTSVPDISPKNPKFDRAIRIWQRLPVELTKIIGPRVVAHIP